MDEKNGGIGKELDTLIHCFFLFNSKLNEKSFSACTCLDWLWVGGERWVAVSRWGTATSKSSLTVRPRSD
jgi:hypothetical protein